MTKETVGMKKDKRYILISAICLPAMALLGLALHCTYMTWEAAHFLGTMNLVQIGSTDQKLFTSKLDSYRNAEGSCIPANEKEAYYAYGFNSPLLVRLKILPDTILMGKAIFEDGILIQKTEFFKSNHFAVSVSEGRPAPYTEFNGHTFIAKSTGSPFGLHIQVNPEATPTMKRPVYALEMKCFLLSEFCRNAHDALPSVEVHDLD